MSQSSHFLSVATSGHHVVIPSHCVTLPSPQGSITALDISTSKLRALDTMAERLGVADMVHTHAADLRTYSWDQQADGTVFDRVLLDSPCSGEDQIAN